MLMVFDLLLEKVFMIGLSVKMLIFYAFKKLRYNLSRSSIILVFFQKIIIFVFAMPKKKVIVV